MFGGCILLWVLICISCSAQGQLGSLGSLHNHPVVQTVCSSITAPNGGWGLLECSSHAWIPLSPLHPHPCGCLLSPACARLSCCPLPQSPCGMQGTFLNSLCANQIHLKASNVHPCLMTGFALLLQPQSSSCCKYFLFLPGFHYFK